MELGGTTIPFHPTIAASTPVVGSIQTSPDPAGWVQSSLGRTFRPGTSRVPEAERDIFRAFKSSIMTTSCFLADGCGFLVRKIIAVIGYLSLRRCMRDVGFCRLAENDETYRHTSFPWEDSNSLFLKRQNPVKGRLILSS